MSRMCSAYTSLKRVFLNTKQFKMRVLLIAFLACTVVLASCKKDDLTLTGGQSAIGEVGNVFTTNAAANIPGVSSVMATITDNQNGISTITGSVIIDDPDLAAIADALATLFPTVVTAVGNTYSGQGAVRFTTDGIAGVYNEGELVLVKYDADVGDEYSLTIDGNKITNKVTSKSSSDDYNWGNGWLLKVVEVKSTGQDLPGVKDVTYYANHKFGMVGVKLNKMNGTSTEANIYSAATNE